jgi:hypothetical protein
VAPDAAANVAEKRCQTTFNQLNAQLDDARAM